MRSSDGSSDVCSSDLEKYKNLARDAQTQGDRVTAEYYLQFADHYFRVLNEHRARQEEFRERQEGQRERPRYPDQRFDDGEDDGGDDLRDDREEDATAPISISGRSDEHTSELQSLMRISYAVFCLKKKNKHK